MNRYLTVLFLSAALAGSVSVRADDHRSDTQTKRYYDKEVMITTSGASMKTRCTTNT